MFISVKEAMELTGMSSTTIYRLCNKRINTLYIRKEDNKFLIDKDFIMASFPADIVKMTEENEVENNTILQEPEFEVVNTADPESKIEFIVDDQPTDINTLAASEEISNQEEDLTLVSLTPKAQIEMNVISSKEDIPTLVSEKAQLPHENIGVSKIFNLETVIGIAASILVIGILIYLFYLDIK